MNKTKILALCDSPADRKNAVRGGATTGFARVAKNLFTEWTALGAEIEIWALHFEGWGYQSVPWQLFPGGNERWNEPKRLNSFLKQLRDGGYTHVFLLMDADAFCVGEGNKTFPKMLREICDQQNIRSMIYFPVDAAQDPEWTEIVAAVDVAVTYTQYGVAEMMKAIESYSPRLARNTKIHVAPHGVEDHFKPHKFTERREARAQFVVGNKPFVKPDDFLVLNLNKNEFRKDPLRSLEIVAALRATGVPAKLVMRMDVASLTGGVYLDRAARQLGLVMGRDWVQLDAIPENDLPSLYNAADLYLTTTMGEGWGLGITEALACDTAVAMSRETSCGEIGDEIIKLQPDRADRIIWLATEDGHVCGPDGRLRRRVDLAKASAAIDNFYTATRDPLYARKPLNDGVRTWLSWSRIGREMFALLENAEEKQVTP